MNRYENTSKGVGTLGVMWGRRRSKQREANLVGFFKKGRLVLHTSCCSEKGGADKSPAEPPPAHAKRPIVKKTSFV